MLKHRRLVVMMVLTVVLTASRISGLYAESSLLWALEANSGITLGHTTYLLDEPDPPAVGVRSELVFPLQTLKTGIKASLGSAGGRKRDWQVRLYAAAALSDPWGLMKDSDWYLLHGYPPIRFSYTESEAELRTLAAGIDGALILWRRDGFSVGAALLYRFQIIEQNVIGYEGWQYVDQDDVFGGAYDLVALSSDARALYYLITYHMPGLGVLFRLSLPKLELEATAAYTLFYVSDYDDHLLRYKLSTASGFGHGLIASAAGRWYLGGGNMLRGAYVGVAADLLLLRAGTRQTQEFYAGPYEGIVYTGLSHLITSTQLDLTVALGWSF